jgi:hypothetical protein
MNHKNSLRHQFGFCKDYSTSLALIDVVDNIYKNLDNGNQCAGIFFGLQKAFDTVDQDFYYLSCILMEFVELFMTGLRVT